MILNPAMIQKQTMKNPQMNNQRTQYPAYETRDGLIESDHIKLDKKDIKLLISNVKANSDNGARRKVNVRRKFC